ncbi:MAG: Re/Si-specific NAD(P)(+) transhydrogenase subunit alpha [Pirellulales bacterium]|nr:Re/Si-specific NAD(P)(+) transhydrogenase subunit alpha [Pirellulales bacterium]
MLVGIPQESLAGERRVAIVPGNIAALKKLGLDVVVESGAGLNSGFADQAFADKGARIGSRAEAFAADIVLQVRALGANETAGSADAEMLRPGATLVCQCEPLSQPQAIAAAAPRGVTIFALELVPRITRAQAMDVLSSMAMLAGYKAVLLAADRLPKMMPMMITAAGTVAPAKVFVIGAGVAGLQAIATARRLGAVVEAYDVRPAVKEQVESLGAKFVELPLTTADAQDKGGYAKAQDEDFYRRQREVMTKVVAASDVVITTAAVPGKQAPILVTRDMVTGMRPGAVVIDLAAERGGNCECTRPGEIIDVGGVAVVGPLNLATTLPADASALYGKNVTTFLALLVKNGALNINLEDEILRESLVAREGQVVHPRLRESLGLAPAVK